MSDQSNGPGWTAPGDATPGDGDDGHEDTTAFSAEQTQRISRQDPPPPPPPPAATGGWAPPPPPGATQGYGPGGWQPPPSPRRRTALIVGIVVGVLVLVVALGAAAVLLARVVSEPVADAPTPSAPGARSDDDRPDAQEVPADDLVAQTEAVLRTIDASEQRMLAFQEAVFGGVEEDGSVGDAAAEIAQAAQEAGDDLTGLRSELQSLAGGDGDGFDGLRDVRDTYAAHMEAWIEYVDAVAGSPAMARPQSPEAEPFWRDIELTGNDFVEAVEAGLPDDLPEELDQLARTIVERGFGGSDSGPSGEVV